jgi:cation-transporting ATPase 13A3/4/5
MFCAWAILWEESWYTFENPIHDLHLQPKDWMLRGDNYDSPVGLLCLFLVLVNSAYVNTYGGPFRANICRNWGIVVCFIAFLIFLYYICLTPPDKVNCLFRVNCDAATSYGPWEPQWFWDIPSWFSVGTIGHCFLGTQTSVWQDQMFAHGFNGTADPPNWWLPNNSAEFQCFPFPAAGSDLAGNCAATTWPSNVDTVCNEDVSTMYPTCVGPNNCWSTSFRWVMAAVMTIYLIVNHIFVQFVLLGPVARGLRRRQRLQDCETYNLPYSVTRYNVNTSSDEDAEDDESNSD